MHEWIFLFRQIGGRVVPFLLQEALYATVLFGVVATVSRLIRFRSPQFRAGLWMLVFIRLILPTDWSHPFSGRSLIFRLIPKQPAAYFVSAGPAGPDVFINTDSGEEGVVLPKTAAAESILFLFWISGMLFFAAVYLKRVSRYRRIIRNAVPVEPGEASACLEAWRAQFGIRRPVRLMTGPGDVSPFTLGVIRPVILIPERVVQSLRRSDLECVIAHELAHVKRWDALWITLQNFLQIGYFFHPLVWMAGGRLGLARECACDGLVLAQGRISSARYGHGLLSLLKMQPFGPDCVALMPSFVNGRHKLITRFEHMKGAHSMRNTLKTGPVVLLAGLALFVLPMAAETPNPEKSPSTSMQTDAAHSETAIPRLILPVPGGRIASGYGERRHPITKKMVLHRGVDIPAKKGTPVWAAAEGMVRVAKSKDYDREGYGKMIVLRHPGRFETLYAQLDSVLIGEGTTVIQGTPIGHVGESGLSTGPHLHFEVRLDGEAVDPELYLTR